MSSEAQGAILDAISEVFEPVISQVKKVRGIHPSAASKASPFTGKLKEKEKEKGKGKGKEKEKGGEKGGDVIGCDT